MRPYLAGKVVDVDKFVSREMSSAQPCDPQRLIADAVAGFGQILDAVRARFSQIVCSIPPLKLDTNVFRHQLPAIRIPAFRLPELPRIGWLPPDKGDEGGVRRHDNGLTGHPGVDESPSSVSDRTLSDRAGDGGGRVRAPQAVDVRLRIELSPEGRRFFEAVAIQQQSAYESVA